MKKSTVRFDFSMMIECPHCGEDIDLVDEEEDGEYSRPIFNNDWNNLRGELVFCPECGKEFAIDCVEY